MMFSTHSIFLLAGAVSIVTICNFAARQSRLGTLKGFIAAVIAILSTYLLTQITIGLLPDPQSYAMALNDLPRGIIMPALSMSVAFILTAPFLLFCICNGLILLIEWSVILVALALMRDIEARKRFVGTISQSETEFHLAARQFFFESGRQQALAAATQEHKTSE